MKSWIILIVLAVALTAAFTVAVPLLSNSSSISNEASLPAPPKPDGPTPIAQVDEDLTYDFGVLPQWVTKYHTWTFRNAGAGMLILRGAGTTCSCTTAALFSETKEGKEVTIKPGESLPIEVTYQTKDWPRFHQAVTIGTNDPDRPTIVLTIEGTPKPAVTAVPGDSTITFGPVSNDMENTRRIAIFSADRPELKLVKITSTNPDLIAVNPRPLTSDEATAIKAEKGYHLDIILKPTSNLGTFAEEILIETDHPQKSELKFKVMGKVTGPITVIPERGVTVRGATASDGGTEKLKIVARNRTSVNFTVEKKPQALEVSIVPIPPAAGAKSSMYNMIVKVIPGTDSGRIVDEIVLRTDDPLAKEVKVPVDILVEGAK